MTNEEFLNKIGTYFGVSGGIEDGWIELEAPTEGGVSMFIGIDVEDSLNLFNQFKEYVDEFDIGEEIDLHREMREYKEAFTIKESLEDFEDYLEWLRGIVEELEEN